MAYTDRAGKIIKNAWGKFYAPAYEAMVPGDLVGIKEASDSFQLADDAGAVVAMAVCLSAPAAGEDAHFALAVEFEAPPTIGDRGVPTAQTLAASTDISSPLYLHDAGKADLSIGGTTVQTVGYILSTTRALLAPGQYLTGTNQSLSGSQAVGTTLAVTGATTLTGALAINGGATVATGKDLTLTKGNVIFTAGSVIRYVQSKDAGVSVAKTDDIIEMPLTDDRTVTLNAIASIGQAITVYHTSGSKAIKIAANAADKIHNTTGSAKDNVTDDSTAGSMITLVAISAHVWATFHSRGTWSYA